MLVITGLVMVSLQATAVQAMPSFREKSGAITSLRSSLPNTATFITESGGVGTIGNVFDNTLALQRDLYTHDDGPGGIINGRKAGYALDISPTDGFNDSGELRIDPLYLSPEEQDSLNEIGNGSPGFGPGNGLDMGARTRGSDRNTDPLLHQFSREINSLYSEVTSFNAFPRGPPQGHTGGNAGSGGLTGLKNDRQIRGIAETISSLRDFVQLQHSETGILLTSDGRSGYAMSAPVPELAVNPMGHGRVSVYSSPTYSSAALANAERNMLNQEENLLIRLLHLLTSFGAFIVYGIIIVCWVAWRYVISRYA